MGTRSITRFYDDSFEVAKRPSLVIYRQYDGYFEGHGADLDAILSEFTLGNGIPYPAPKGFANGPGCLFAQVLCALKTEPGGIYIVEVDHPNEEFNYEVRANFDGIMLRGYGDDDFMEHIY